MRKQLEKHNNSSKSNFWNNLTNNNSHRLKGLVAATSQCHLSCINGQIGPILRTSALRVLEGKDLRWRDFDLAKLLYRRKEERNWLERSSSIYSREKNDSCLSDSCFSSLDFFSVFDFARFVSRFVSSSFIFRSQIVSIRFSSRSRRFNVFNRSISSRTYSWLWWSR